MRFDTGEWLKRAMDAYGESVWRLAYVMTGNRHVSEDVFQETFSKLYLSKRDFESGDHVKNWLLKVAGNQCRSILRAKKRWRVVPYEPSIHDTPKIKEGASLYARCLLSVAVGSSDEVSDKEIETLGRGALSGVTIEAAAELENKTTEFACSKIE